MDYRSCNSQKWKPDRGPDDLPGSMFETRIMRVLRYESGPRCWRRTRAKIQSRARNTSSRPLLLPPRMTTQQPTTNDQPPTTNQDSMARTFLLLGSLGGFIGVALGAFGAHGLRSRLSPDMLAVFETGVRYQMYHAFAL